MGTSFIVPYAQTEMGLAFLVCKEATIGLIMGFVARLFFDALSFGFGYMGLQMGFNAASAYDHHIEANTPVISQLIMILATLIFLSLNGHHLFLRAIMQSMETIPIGGISIHKDLPNYLLELSTSIFLIGVKISAPMSLLIFLLNCAFGIISKAVPQINVLVVSFSVNILAGFLVILLTLPLFGANVNEVFQMMFQKMIHVITFLA